MPALAITTTTPNPQLNAQRRGDVSFTVTNQSGGKIKGRAEVKPEDPAQAQWLRIGDPAEREFEPDGVQQFVVSITVPETAPEGTCKFRLNVISTSKRTGDEESVEGPSVSVPVPKPPPKDIKPFPWWIVAVAAGVLVVVAGVVAWIMTRPPGLGHPCKDGECAAGLWCPDKICREDKTGSDCQTDQDCAGQVCAQVSDGKICMRKAGAPCQKENWAQCASLFCKDGKCAVSPNGATCRNDVQCQSGNCKDGVCAAVETACPPCPPFTVCRNGQCVPRLAIPIPRNEILRVLPPKAMMLKPLEPR